MRSTKDPHTGVAWLLMLLKAACIVVTAGCCAFFIYYVAARITDGHADQFASVYHLNAELKAGGQGSYIFDSFDTAIVLFTWLPIAVAALAMLVVAQIPISRLQEEYWGRLFAARCKVKKVLAMPIYPSKFWYWWCGGLNGSELLAISVWLVLHVFYLQQYLRLYLKLIEAHEASGLHFQYSRGTLMLEWTGLTFGIMLWPSLWLLFFPIPHCSFLISLMGIPWQKMIRYHRWLGHGTMTVLTLHGVFYYLYWLSIHEPFWDNFGDWGKNQAINNLAGSLGWWAGLALWITSLQWVRRRMFKVFYRFHIVCFLLFTAFAYMHYYWSWSYFLPGLLIYAVELVLRAGQLTYLVPVRVTTSQHSTIITMEVPVDKDFRATPGQEVYVCIPMLGSWDWHPFTIQDVQQDHANTPVLVLHVKCYSAWTKDLLALSSKRCRVYARISGPLGISMDIDTCLHHEHVVFIAGGIGATPLLASLHDIAERKECSSHAWPLQKLTFIWVSKHGDEFAVLNKHLTELPRDWLEFRFYTTSTASLRDSLKPVGTSMTSNSSNESCDVDIDKLRPQTQSAEHRQLAPYMPRPYAAIATRVVPAKLTGTFFEAAVVLLTFAGALFATILVSAYLAEYQYTTESPPYAVYWKVGLLYAIAQATGALGLPYALVMMPLHAFRWRKLRLAAAMGGETDKPGTHLPCHSPTDLSIQDGRPDLPGILRSVASVVTSKQRMAVHVAGPDSMTLAVQLAVCELQVSGTAVTWHQDAITL